MPRRIPGAGESVVPPVGCELCGSVDAPRRPFDVVNGEEQARDLATRLLWRGLSFQVQPMPGDRWRFTVRASWAPELVREAKAARKGAERAL